MPIKNLITSAAVSLSIAASSLIPFASAANAGDWGHRNGRNHHSAYAYRYQAPVQNWNRNSYAQRWSRNHNDYRNDRHDRRDGTKIAIGLTALAIAAIIASQASRDRHY